ncbi:MAG: hypothetical protein ACUVRH_00530 [Candidatus Bipolaricaulia bacterium]
MSGLTEEPFPPKLDLVYTKACELQGRAALYAYARAGAGEGPSPLLPFAQLHGPPPSYEDILNLEVTLRAATAFARPTAALAKHGDLCGLASAETIAEAFALAYRADERAAAEWSLAGLNRALTREAAKLLAKEPIAALLAPGYEPEALEVLRKRKGFKVFQAQARAGLGLPQEPLELEGLELHGTIFGLLVRVRGRESELAEPELRVMSKREPTEEEWADLRFAWRALAWLRREAALIVRDECLVGLGAGQPSLIDAVALAIRKAGPRAKGAVLASSALPNRGPIDLAAAARLAGIIAAAGSTADQELIRAADEHGMALVLVGLLGQREREGI